MVCVCSYSNQNECIKGCDACNEATPADEVCTLQFSLVGIFVSHVLIWKCTHTSLYFLQLMPSKNIASVEGETEVCCVQPIWGLYTLVLTVLNIIWDRFHKKDLPHIRMLFKISIY